MAHFDTHPAGCPYAAKRRCERMQRRTLLTSMASAAGGSIAGAALIASTDTASASVSMGELDMSGAQQTTSNGYINNVRATVSGSWSYELPGGEVDRWIVELRVSDGDVWYTVGQTSKANEYRQYSGTYEVSGSITETEGFSVGYFSAPGPGKQTSVELPLQVRFRVMSANDTPLANTSIEDSATVTVGQQEIDASLYGEVSGQGSVNIKT